LVGSVTPKVAVWGTPAGASAARAQPVEVEVCDTQLPDPPVATKVVCVTERPVNHPTAPHWALTTMMKAGTLVLADVV
jgi:hypothetical protein